MLNDTLKQRRIVTAIALEGRTEADLLELIDSVPDLARLDGNVESPKGISGSLEGQTVAIGNAAYFAALGLATAHLCDWPERIRSHGQEVLFIAIDGRAIGVLGVTDAI
jgi:cation transport ATPase